MIVELVVENFRSIKEKQRLSLVKSNFGDADNNSFNPLAPGTSDLLKSAAIYGANAAGKSNFILALSTMQEIVIMSAKDRQRGYNLPVQPFKLCDSTIDEPTEFEVTFIADSVKYQYGFSTNSTQITAEWLYAFPNGKPQRWFIRVLDPETSEYVWDFGSYLMGKKQLWKEATRSNSLFLSTAIMLNSEQLKPVYDWFYKTLKLSGISGWNMEYTAKLCQKNESKEHVLNFLKAADLDIDDIRVDTKKMDKTYFPDELPASIKEKMLEELEGEEFHEIKTIHKTSSGKNMSFDLSDESDGTQKIFAFAGPWIDSLNKGKVLFIDELHDSLHPSIVKFLVSLFHDKKTNPNNAQLIFTTHETSILDQNIFRRDQVWFCNKEKNQSTSLYPLTDFSPRKGVENLEKAYLTGRYGALPLISALEYIGE
ncbi:ATP-binding protein [Pseudoalteromonas sp. SWXJZ94C]|uniref:AAA family ATPase n=1 Tax=Pseudoalteromonas sp. SWXJZ94C TaxID=2792065 RepID=UPI0018CFA070|nr:ATP-binding protein [Pseudoalteromonas sp. SWXJZ94C]MBH0057564.1 ATP-binding protein [Pseudoalteromonas sp. SWXJZ94C]